MCEQTGVAFHLDREVTDDRIKEETMFSEFLFEDCTECAFICPDGFIYIPLQRLPFRRLRA